ncbi:hypothetical protein Q9233_000552 [Columba guinea]|nr:hypothetical protein Q9233_000552 [Columba guinea]
MVALLCIGIFEQAFEKWKERKAEYLREQSRKEKQSERIRKKKEEELVAEKKRDSMSAVEKWCYSAGLWNVIEKKERKEQRAKKQKKMHAVHGDEAPSPWSPPGKVTY